MGRPVICAAKTTPGLATRAGPFGPSGVKTRLLPCLRALRMNSRSASFAPRDDEPRTVPTPYQRNTRAIFLYGEPVFVPRDGDVEEWRVLLERSLNDLADEAEQNFDELWRSR